MKILVLGRDGQLGKCLFDQFLGMPYDMFFAGRSDIDICDFTHTSQKIRDISPNIVINAAAYTGVDNAESDQQMADKVNNSAVPMSDKSNSTE